MRRHAGFELANMKRRPKLPFLNKKQDNHAVGRTNQKRIHHIQALPIEIIAKIFKYLSPSDILRCARVCQSWLEASNENDIWHLQFRRLPKKIQSLSLEAKKPKSYVNWKKETIVCLKKARKKKMQALLKKISPYTGLPEKTSAALRSLEVCWNLEFTDSHGNKHEVISKDTSDFSSSLSVCWNDIELPQIGELRECALFSNAPIFVSGNGCVVEDSVCTRSLFVAVSLRDFSKQTTFLGKDQFISIYYHKFGFVFGVWHDKSLKKCSIAFVTLYVNLKNIIERILGGTSDAVYTCPAHEPILDDLDGKYGLQRYSALIELRTNRKLLWSFQVQEFYKARVENDFLVMTDERPIHQGSFDIPKSIRLPWRSGSIKGIIKNVAVIDFSLTDGNKEFIWVASEPVAASQVSGNEVQFDDDGSEKLTMVLDDLKKGTLTLHLSYDGKSDSCAVREIEVRLKISFINEWFGTSYKPEDIRKTLL